MRVVAGAFAASMSTWRRRDASCAARRASASRAAPAEQARAVRSARLLTRQRLGKRIVARVRRARNGCVAQTRRVRTVDRRLFETAVEKLLRFVDELHRLRGTGSGDSP